MNELRTSSRVRRRNLRLLPLALCTLLFCVLPAANSQELALAAIPDAPVPQNQSDSSKNQQANAVAAAAGQPHQTKRILGVIPNFRAVSADVHLPPQTVKEKFDGTVEESFDYSAFIFVAALAGVAQAENSYPEFHQGAAGYGRYYWHTLVDQTDENFWVQFILPAALHQDSRYYTLGHGNILHRAVYAFDRTLITRDDSGHEDFNYSEVIGAGAASGISDLYYPSQEETWTKTGQRWLTNGILDGATYVFQEFWPDINNAVFHQKD